MPSVIHTILLALHATAFTALSQTSIYALAAPLPGHHTPYNPPVFSLAKAARPLPRSMRIARNPSLVVPTTSRPQTPPTSKTPSANKADPYVQFSAYYKAASDNSRNLKKLAAQSVSMKRSDPEFEAKCVTQLNSFRTNVLGQQAALSAIEADKRRPGGKGLENYDRTNDIETMIKETVNLTKNTLSAVSVLVNNVPIIGPIVGPILYDVKCFLDDILNFTENFLDATLNKLQPLLGGLLGSSPSRECLSGVKLLGLCI